jgi:HAD superfamily hydrolase (TIGR01509 family)
MPTAPRFTGAALFTTSTTAQRSAILAAAVPTSIDALIFDCDGVIVESEDIHRRAYNAAFEEFDIICPGETSPAVWSVEFYDMLQNKVGGGKPKMRWYFGEVGWPTSNILGGKTAETDEEKTILIDTLQDWKTDKYKDIIVSGQVEPRPGILKLMDDARASGTPVAVCSASTKAAVDFVLPALLGKERFESLDLYMAGDDVPLKKPDPSIYKVAAERLKVDPARCLVIEDSMIGLAAALGAGMQCVITYHSGTESQDFPGASAVLANMDGMEFADLAGGKVEGRDDRKVAAGAASKSA